MKLEKEKKEENFPDLVLEIKKKKEKNSKSAAFYDQGGVAAKYSDGDGGRPKAESKPSIGSIWERQNVPIW